jgi:deazaflavin-dependent oxidoreductase (nitroreductase family)
MAKTAFLTPHMIALAVSGYPRRMNDEDLFGEEHVRVYRETDGERGYDWKNGTKILLLTTKGRNSGEERTTPLIHQTDDGRWVVIASQGGAPDDPNWFKNIEAEPGDVEIQVKADRIPVEPRVAEGEERERLWKLMTEVWPDYDEYQERTDREIPVVVLEPR